MDVNLLSKLIRESLFDQEKVVICGLGYFYTEQVPAKFSDDGKSILPPYLKTSFQHDENISDEHLKKLFIHKTDLKLEEAISEWDSLLSELKETLKRDGKVEIPQIGDLVYDSQGIIALSTEDNSALFNTVYGFEQIPIKPIVGYIPTIEISHDLSIESVTSGEEEKSEEVNKVEEVEETGEEKIEQIEEAGEKVEEAVDVDRLEETVEKVEEAGAEESAGVGVEVGEEVKQIEEAGEKVEEAVDVDRLEETVEKVGEAGAEENIAVEEKVEEIATPAEAIPEVTPANEEEESQTPDYKENTNSDDKDLPTEEDSADSTNVSEPINEAFEKKGHLVRNIIIIIAATIIVIIAAIILLGTSGMLDTILYTPEELELIDKFGN